MNLYKMGLHDIAEIKHKDVFITKITRVPGGWIYNQAYMHDNSSSSVFVPFSLELMKKESEESDD